MRTLLLILILLANLLSFGQLRRVLQPNTSCFSSNKVDTLIADLRRSSEKKSLFYNSRSIKPDDFLTLSALDHFVYAFNYPEQYTQSCSNSTRRGIKETLIYSNLWVIGMGYTTSVRQYVALAAHRDSTILLIKKCAYQEGFDYHIKKAILRLDAFELIPDLINRYLLREDSLGNDEYILTTLCLLMKDRYKLFQNTALHKKMYPKPNKNSPLLRDISIPFSNKNLKIIIDNANEYYTWRKQQPNDYIIFPKNRYYVGSWGNEVNPNRSLDLNSFQVSKYEVTNKEFSTFIKSTGYVTLAEQHKDAMVFIPGLDEFEWIQDPTANWRFPNGIKRGGIEDKMDYPVTCISYLDAEAYCKWAKVRLPTIEEWEIASRAGSHREYFFGDTNAYIHQYANVWHGQTHLQVDSNEDFIYTSPVGSFKPNPNGLFDIYGNVFEFCSNLPKAFSEYEDIAATRGGSWWCSKSSCNFFNSVDIGRVKKRASFSNNGFRVVR